MKKEKNLTTENSQNEQENSKFLLTSLPTNLLTRKSFAFTLAEGATHVAPSKACRRGGFTLAEVLITLAVVGVVAALTMPSVINHFRVKDLEARFKKVSSRLEQALTMASLELGIDNFNNYNIYPAGASELVPLQEYLDGYFKRLGAVKVSDSEMRRRLKNITPTNFKGVLLTGGHHIGTAGFMGDTFLYLFPDSSTISAVHLNIHYAGAGSNYILFNIDTNGPQNGPNRWGHDVFTYSNAPKRANGRVVVYGLCDPLSANSYAIARCYHYAKANIPPNPVFKTYWDSLFKSESFWKNLKDSQ